MPQSFAKLYVHLVFSTKNRERCLCQDFRPRVHGYLAETIRELGSPWCVVGGVEDHVHILFELPKSHSLVDVVEQTKRNSSKFIKTLHDDLRPFYWQRGYAAFSVSPNLLPHAETYVRQQEQHHASRSYQDELRAMLNQYEVQFDERYIWD